MRAPSLRVQIRKSVPTDIENVIGNLLQEKRTVNVAMAYRGASLQDISLALLMSHSCLTVSFRQRGPAYNKLRVG